MTSRSTSAHRMRVARPRRPLPRPQRWMLRRSSSARSSSSRHFQSCSSAPSSTWSLSRQWTCRSWWSTALRCSTTAPPGLRVMWSSRAPRSPQCPSTLPRWPSAWRRWTSRASWPSSRGAPSSRASSATRVCTERFCRLKPSMPARPSPMPFWRQKTTRRTKRSTSPTRLNCPPWLARARLGRLCQRGHSWLTSRCACCERRQIVLRPSAITPPSCARRTASNGSRASRRAERAASLQHPCEARYARHRDRPCHSSDPPPASSELLRRRQRLKFRRQRAENLRTPLMPILKRRYDLSASRGVRRGPVDVCALISVPNDQ
mmetsp:Transcript_20590/g.55517  ORF Transcript_20590/g.55517 Transcript_20590/m.55517 type:complete len:319 (-) Transcript_20590:42-998(-)